MTHATIPVDSLAEGASTIYRIGHAKVLIARSDGEVYATSAICTHARVELASPRLTPECLIECPMHGALFSPIDGAVHDGPAITPLKTYDTQIVDGIIHVDVGDDAFEPTANPNPSTPGTRPSLASWGRPE